MEPVTLEAYRGLRPFYGDLHNHCGISYGHGSIEEAFANARERLDFCSVTGHAFWPDMPAPTPQTRHVVDYHRAGFDRLRRGWPDVVAATQAANDEGRLVTFLSFEMHSMADGDHTVVYRDGTGEVLYCDGLSGLARRVADLRRRGVAVMAFPHHLGYPRGRRGVNWERFDTDLSPVVEIVSMHGCSESSEVPRPFLHSMGPSDHRSTMAFGLAAGKVFGVIGSTDHHSAHPGSYGHGLAAIWADDLTRAGLWDGLLARRTCALTGDRIALQFALNGRAMGSRLGPCRARRVEVAVHAGGAIDCVDLVRNGRLIRRVSECDLPAPEAGPTIRTRLLLELGWGARGRRTDWDVLFGVSDGRIVEVEPRFRGGEIVSPTDRGADAPSSNHYSHWEPAGPRAARFRTITFGNPNNATRATQGLCLEADLPADAEVWAELNGRRVTVPLPRLLEGAAAGHLGGHGSAAYRFARAPLPGEFQWTLRLDDDDRPAARDVYYVRVRQKNDQWAWSSPVFVG